MKRIFTATTRRATSRDIRRALKHFKFEALLLNAGLDVEEKNGEVAGECYLCHWKRTSFYVQVGVGVWICHACGERGGPIQLISDILNISIGEAIERVIAGHVGAYEEVDDEEEEEEVVEIRLPDEYRRLDTATSLTSQRYREYVLERGLTERMLRDYDIGYCPTGWLRKRIIVPVYHLGTLVNYVARWYKEKPPKGVKKVLTPPGNTQGDYLFNLDHIWGTERVVITEGVFDALALPDIAVATFGKKVSDRQVNILAAAGVKDVVLAWDADAQTEIWQAYLRLRNTFSSVKVMELPEGEDPSSIGHEGVLQWLEAAFVPEEPVVDSNTELKNETRRLI